MTDELIKWNTCGHVYRVYKDGGKTVHWEGALEEARLCAEIHAKNGGEDTLFRFFRNVPDGQRFTIAWYVKDGLVLEWLDVSIPEGFK